MAQDSPISERSAFELFVKLRNGWLVSRALHAAAELGVADVLSEGAKTSAQVAAATGANAGALYRLLRMLAAYGVFEEDAAGCFKLTPIGSLLRRGALRDATRMIGDADWNAYGNLVHSIRTGEPAFQHVYGVQFFDYLARNPQANARFDQGMASFSTSENSAVASAYDFGRFRKIVDVGGGRGGLIAEILKAHPSTSGVLCDQPQVVANPEYIAAAGVEARCEIVAVNIFESVPAGSDAYVLKRILHDWNDETCEPMLRRCRDAMREGGRVLAIDAVVPGGNAPHPSKDVDLLMMVLLGGKERTEPEFRQLFARSGLKLNRIIPTSSTMSIIEGERA